MTLKTEQPIDSLYAFMQMEFSCNKAMYSITCAAIEKGYIKYITLQTRRKCHFFRRFSGIDGYYVLSGSKRNKSLIK